MCGLWGFVGNNPDGEIVSSIINEASKRGPHAFGYSHAGTCYRGIGELVLKLPIESSVIGLSRLATFGRWDNQQSSQPIEIDEYRMVHNGNIYNYCEIFDEISYTPVTDVDSEALLAFILFGGDDIYDGVSKSIAKIDSPMAAIVLCPDDSAIAIRGKYLPLYFFWGSNDAIYFCSRPVHGHECFMIPENTAIHWKI